MTEPYKSEGLLFSCIQCGRCCRRNGIVVLTPQEMEKISAFLGLSSDEGLRCYATRQEGRLVLRDGPRGECIFYEWATARCKVYLVRPHQCRQYPFWPSILKNRENWEEERKLCPGIGEWKPSASGRGPVVSREEERNDLPRNNLKP
ncbi:MAG: YkgJ family cysteine cluster protein [Synergistaceae bacterium]|nr:YkgJ family cysteine cluster protein [Synergistaceae bacterium]